MSSFEEWWIDHGASMRPQNGESQEGYIERIARLAWHEGRRKAFREAIYELRRYQQENCAPVTPEAMVIGRCRRAIAQKEPDT